MERISRLRRQPELVWRQNIPLQWSVPGAVLFRWTFGGPVVRRLGCVGPTLVELVRCQFAPLQHEQGGLLSPKQDTNLPNAWPAQPNHPTERNPV